MEASIFYNSTKIKIFLHNAFVMNNIQTIFVNITQNNMKCAILINLYTDEYSFSKACNRAGKKNWK